MTTPDDRYLVQTPSAKEDAYKQGARDGVEYYREEFLKRYHRFPEAAAALNDALLTVLDEVRTALGAEEHEDIVEAAKRAASERTGADEEAP